MGDELTVSVSQQPARDPAAMLGRGSPNFADAAEPTADRAAPIAVIGRVAPPAPAVSMDLLDIRALPHPTEHFPPADHTFVVRGCLRPRR